MARIDFVSVLLRVESSSDSASFCAACETDGQVVAAITQHSFCKLDPVICSNVQSCHHA